MICSHQTLGERQLTDHACTTRHLHHFQAFTNERAEFRAFKAHRQQSWILKQSLFLTNTQYCVVAYIVSAKSQDRLRHARLGDATLSGISISVICFRPPDLQHKLCAR